MRKYEAPVLISSAILRSSSYYLEPLLIQKSKSEIESVFSRLI